MKPWFGLKQSNTFRRMFESRHVNDLKIIVVGTVIVGIGFIIYHHIVVHGSELDGKFTGAVVVFAGTIVAWAYQTGSKRLGVVDLFACEIVTLCRVGTITRFIPRLIAAFDSLNKTPETLNTRPKTPASGECERFPSKENYFPVFENGTMDLQILQADVVINVTAYYTYMKTLRDYLRRLSEISQGTTSEKCNVLLNAIYMTFLGYESARKSVGELVEYQPTRAEAKIAVLMTEVPAFRFLRDHLSAEDFRGRRLALREPKYGSIVPDLFDEIMNASGEDWENARSSAIDLGTLYNELGFRPRIQHSVLDIITPLEARVDIEIADSVSPLQPV